MHAPFNTLFAYQLRTEPRFAVGDSPFSALETHSRLNHSAYRIREPVILMTAGSEARYCACSGENRSSLMLTFSLHRAIICMGFAGRIDVPYATPHAQSEQNERNK